jgi:hypothetical protein
MINKVKFGQILFATVLILSMVACGGGTTPVPPTNTPAPIAATNTPVPPTDVPPTPVPPTDVPAAPTATAEIAATEPPTQGGGERTPGQLNVLALGSWVDDSDYVYISGLISNDTNRAVDSIEVEVKVFDAENTALYTDTVYTALYTVAPGEITPFSMSTWDALPTADHFEATIVGSSSSDYTRAAVEVSKMVQVYDDYGTLHVTGMATNTGDKPIYFQGIAFATFDANGEIIAADSESVSLVYLEPGQSGPFRVNVEGPDDHATQAAKVEMYTDAYVTDAQDAYNLGFLEQDHRYMDAYGYPHLVGEVTNNDTKNLKIYLVVAIYNEAGDVIDASSAWAPYVLAPGEKAAYDFDYWGPMEDIDGVYDEAEQYEIFIDYYWTYDTDETLVELNTGVYTVEWNDYRGYFTGTVTNDTDAVLEYTYVAVNLVDKASGQVVATDYDIISDEIAPGAKGNFEIYVSIPDGFDPNSVDIVFTVKAEK